MDSVQETTPPRGIPDLIGGRKILSRFPPLPRAAIYITLAILCIGCAVWVISASIEQGSIAWDHVFLLLWPLLALFLCWGTTTAELNGDYLLISTYLSKPMRIPLRELLHISYTYYEPYPYTLRRGIK